MCTAGQVSTLGMQTPSQASRKKPTRFSIPVSFRYTQSIQVKNTFERETPFPLLPCILATDHRKPPKPLRHVMYSSEDIYVAPVCSAAHAQALSTKEPVWTWAITLRSGGSADGVRSQLCGLRRKAYDCRSSMAGGRICECV